MKYRNYFMQNEDLNCHARDPFGVGRNNLLNPKDNPQPMKPSFTTN